MVVGRALPIPALMDEAEADQAYRNVFRDPEFQALVSERYVWFNVTEYEEAVPFVDRVLELIEMELGAYD